MVGDAEIALVKEIYAAINRNDVPAAVAMLDSQIEWLEPPDFPTPGHCHGHAEVTAHISRGRNSWAEGSCVVEDVVLAGDRIVVFLYAWVRLHDRADWVGGRFADVVTFCDGKPIQVRNFSERRDALAWAGA